jgi:hypothetical protein
MSGSLKNVSPENGDPYEGAAPEQDDPSYQQEASQDQPRASRQDPFQQLGELHHLSFLLAGGRKPQPSGNCRASTLLASKLLKAVKWGSTELCMNVSS